jgi:hypothetical protein
MQFIFWGKKYENFRPLKIAADSKKCIFIVKMYCKTESLRAVPFASLS